MQGGDTFVLENVLPAFDLKNVLVNNKNQILFSYSKDSEHHVVLISFSPRIKSWLWSARYSGEAGLNSTCNGEKGNQHLHFLREWEAGFLFDLRSWNIRSICHQLFTISCVFRAIGFTISGHIHMLYLWTHCDGWKKFNSFIIFDKYHLTISRLQKFAAGSSRDYWRGGRRGSIENRI